MSLFKVDFMEKGEAAGSDASLAWWQIMLAFAEVIMIISGPSMVIAWLKLRQRNLAPLLDANGWWAVHTRARINKKRPWWLYMLIAILLLGGFAYRILRQI